MDEKIVLLEKERSLHISRIPKNTKDAFIELANEEFAGDYGMTLKSLFDNFSLWKLLFENLDFKMDMIINKLNTQTEESSGKEIKTLSGRRIELKGGKKNE